MEYIVCITKTDDFHELALLNVIQKENMLII